MTRRYLWLGVQLAITVALLAFLFRQFDWMRFGDVLRRMSPAFYVGSLLALVFDQLLYALRWQIVLSGMGVKIRYAEVLRQYLIGMFLGNVIPTAVGGDAAKVYYLGKQAGYVQVGASVFVDRFLGFFWLAVIGAALAWIVGADTPLLVLNRNLMTLFALGFVSMLAAVWLAPIDRLLPVKLGEFARAVRVGGCRPATLAAAGLVLVLYLAVMTFVYQKYFDANELLHVSQLAVMNVIVSMAVFVNVPISVNGIGLREQLHFLLFAELGIPKEVSVSLSLLLFSHSLLISFVGWVLWLQVRPAPVVSGTPA